MSPYAFQPGTEVERIGWSILRQHAGRPALFRGHELQSCRLVTIVVPEQETAGRPDGELVQVEQMLHAYPIDVRICVERLGDQPDRTTHQAFEQHLVAIAMGG